MFTKSKLLEIQFNHVFYSHTFNFRAQLYSQESIFHPQQQQQQQQQVKMTRMKKGTRNKILKLRIVLCRSRP